MEVFEEEKKMERAESKMVKMGKAWLATLSPLPRQPRKQQPPALPALPPQPGLPQLPPLAQAPQLPRLPSLPQRAALPPVPRQPPLPAEPCPESPRATGSRGTELGSAGQTGPRARSVSARLPPQPQSPLPGLLSPPSTGAQEATARPALAAGASREPPPVPAAPSAAPASQSSLPGTAPLRHEAGRELSLVSDTQLLQELHRRGLLRAGRALSLVSDTELLQELHSRDLLCAGPTEAPLPAASPQLLGGTASRGQPQEEEDKEPCQGTDGLGQPVSQGEDGQSQGESNSQSEGESDVPSEDDSNVQAEGESNVQELSQLEEDTVKPLSPAEEDSGKQLSPGEEHIGKQLSPEEEDVGKQLSPVEEDTVNPVSPVEEKPVLCSPTDTARPEHRGPGKEPDVESQLELPQRPPRGILERGMHRIRNWFRNPRKKEEEEERRKRQLVEKWLEDHLACNYNINEERKRKGEELARQRAEQREREYREKYEGRTDWMEDFLRRSSYCPLGRDTQGQRRRPRVLAQGEKSNTQGLPQEKAEQEERPCQGPGENDQAKELPQGEDNGVQGLAQGDDDPLEGPSSLCLPANPQQPLSSEESRADTSPFSSEEQMPAGSRSPSGSSQALRDAAQHLIHEVLSEAVLEVQGALAEGQDSSQEQSPGPGRREPGVSPGPEGSAAALSQPGGEAQRALSRKRPSLFRQMLHAVHGLLRWPRRIRPRSSARPGPDSAARAALWRDLHLP